MTSGTNVYEFPYRKCIQDSKPNTTTGTIVVCFLKRRAFRTAGPT